MDSISHYNKAHTLRAKGSEDGSVRIAPRSKTKKWQGIYHKYVQLPDGSSRRDTAYRIIGLVKDFTKKEAEVEHRDWCKEFHKAPHAAKITGKHAPTVADIALDYIKFKEGDWRGSTTGGGKSVVTAGIIPALGHLTLKEVTAEHLRTYLHSLPDRVHAERKNSPNYTRKTGASHSYVLKTITHFRGMFALAQERDLIIKNPTQSILVKLTKPKGLAKVDKSVFPPQKLPAFLAQLNERDSLIVWISVLAGTRPGELFAIHGNDIGPGYIAIRHALDGKRKIKETKTEEPRFVSLPPLLNEKIQAWVRANGVGPDDLFFSNRNGRPLIVGDFRQRVLYPAAEKVGIAGNKVNFRALRRSFGTIASSLGFDIKSIQSQLGHSTPDMSYAEYVQPVNEQLAAHMVHMENVLLGLAPMPFDITKKFASERIQ